MSTTFIVLSLLVALLLFAMLAAVSRAGSWAVGQARRGEPLLPDAPARLAPWGIGSVVLVAVVWLAFNAGVSIAYMAVAGGVRARNAAAAGGAPKSELREFSLTEVMFVMTLVNVGVLLTVPPLLRLTSGARLSDFGIETRGLGRQVAVGVGAFLCATPFVYAFQFVFALLWKPTSHKLEEMVRTNRSEGIAQLAIVSAVVLAPAAEELIFRGVLQSWLYRLFSRRPEPELPEIAPDPLPSTVDPTAEPTDDSDFAPLYPVAQKDAVGPPWLRLERAELHAILLTSIIFGAVHLPQWPAPLAIFVLSLVLGLVYKRTGSLISTIVMHASFNALGTLLLFWALELSDTLPQIAKPPAACAVSGQHPGALPQRQQSPQHIDDSCGELPGNSVGATPRD